MSKVLGLVLAAFMFITGVTHFTAPTYYRKLVPAWIPAAPALVVLSGLLNVGVATLLAAPGTRRYGGWATAALITAYLPAHVDAARYARRASGLNNRPIGVAARILANLGYIAWALIVARTAPPPRR